MVSDPEDSTLLGRRIGVYQLQAWLGAGGMGTVYRAHDTRLRRDVAIKILPREVTSDADRRARFERESRVLAALNHPNIAAIYGVEDGPIESGHDVRALVLELVEGETLAQRIARGPIALADVMTIARQMADALDAAHEGGIIHRDLKPANIKLRADGVVKLLDFGIAKVFVGEGAITEESPTVTAAGTRAGTILGTAAYMSPEHARGRSVDKRTDIWAFGCVLYEMLTGRAPFKGETGSDTIVAILEHEPDWRALPGATPPRIRELLRRCLEKDPKRRLRDIADAVIELTPDQSADSGIADPMRPPVSGPRKWIWVAASLALIGAVGTAFWLWPRTGAPHAPALTAVPLTTYPGFESYPSLSPDGNQVAFVWDGEREDNFDIYVKLVGPGAALRLTTDPAVDTTPAWSPDGRWIAFVRLLPNEKGALILIPALGGPERQLGEIAVTSFISMGGLGSAAAWSPDSSSLIVTDKPSPAEPGGLFAWSVATGERRRLTSLPPKAWIDVGPALSPDGRTLAFARFVGFGISDLYLLPLAGDLRPIGAPKRLTNENRFTVSPAWVPDSRDIIFSSGSLTAGPISLFAIDSSGLEGGNNKPRRLTSIGERGALVSISRPSGGGPARMVFVEPQFDSGIWRMELPGRTGQATPAGPKGAPFILSTRSEYLPQYSPDGERVAFVSTSSGAAEIWTCDKNGANLMQLTTAAWPETATPRWAPDSSQIVFQARPEGPGDIFTLPAGGGVPKRFTDDPADDWGSSWSRDGQWIYFGSNRSGRFEIWKAPAGGGTAVQVSKNGGYGPSVSPDGRYVYYKKGADLWRIPVDGGDESQVLKSLSDWSRFALAEEGIYFIPGESPSLKTRADYVIKFFSFSNEKIHTVAQLEKHPFIGLTVSPDGRWLLYSQTDHSGTDLMLVEAFR